MVIVTFSPEIRAAWYGPQISFVLANVTRIREPAWWNFVAPGQLYSQMVAAVHQGTYADLNIITTAMQDDQGHELLGCGAPASKVSEVFGSSIFQKTLIPQNPNPLQAYMAPS